MINIDDMSWDEYRETLLDAQAGDTVLSQKEITCIAESANDIFIYAEAAIALTKCKEISLSNLDHYIECFIEDKLLKRSVKSLVLYFFSKDLNKLYKVLEDIKTEKSFVIKSMMLGKLAVMSIDRDLPLVKEAISHAMKENSGKNMNNNLKTFISIIDESLKAKH